MSIPITRVLIVEDDAVIANLYSRFIELEPNLRLVGIARTATSAIGAVKTLDPSLIVLDYGLPGGTSGIDLLRALRGQGCVAEVIAATAQATPSTVRESMRLGVIDYLVKPFSEDRLRQALRNFSRLSAAARGATLEQSQIDLLRRATLAQEEWVPRELSATKLADVRRLLDTAETAVSAEELASQIGASRVTARRYLEFLVARNQADTILESDRPGRPRKLYTATVSVFGDVPPEHAASG